MLGGLLDMFAPAVLADEPDLQDKKLRQFLPLEVFQRPGPHRENRDEALQRLTASQPEIRPCCPRSNINGIIRTP
jgi:dGTPase